MASEKAIYWLAVFILALGATNGFVNQHKQWGARIADGSITMAEQASEMATRYANMAELRLDRGNHDFNRAQVAAARAQVRLARVQGTMARCQAEMARAQAGRIRAQVMEHRLREVIVCPRQKFAIDAPQPSQVFEEDTF